MVNIDTHKIIDMIFSRELDDVVKWLKTYPNINIVSRDGSITYKKAISLALPKAAQISDRFHLIKNLTTYCKEYITKNLKSKIMIEKSSNIKNRNTTNKISSFTLNEKALKAVKMFKLGLSKTQICKNLNLNIRTLNKIITLDNDSLKCYGKSKLQLGQQERAEIKQKIINKVREMKRNYMSISQISKELNLDRRTVTRYLDSSTTGLDIRGKRKSKLDPYVKIINNMHELGATSVMIFQEIKDNGYTGSSSNLRTYISKLNNFIIDGSGNNSCDKTKHMFIDRNLLIKLLFKPIDKIKDLSVSTLKKIYEKFPRYKEIINLISDFKVLIKNKAVDSLDKWIIEASKLNIPQINSFINGILRDIDAVKNSIIYDYNNGLAEGSVNKLKVVKRIMYGRCGFQLLKSKILNIDNMKFN